jgi:hypothetical protein
LATPPGTFRFPIRDRQNHPLLLTNAATSPTQPHGGAPFSTRPPPPPPSYYQAAPPPSLPSRSALYFSLSSQPGQRGSLTTGTFQGGGAQLPWRFSGSAHRPRSQSSSSPSSKVLYAVAMFYFIHRLPFGSPRIWGPKSCELFRVLTD